MAGRPAAMLCPAVLCLALLAGCTSTQQPAPVFETGLRGARHPVPLRVPAPARKPVAAQAGSYVVQAGDTLFKIAFEQGLDYRELATWNDLADPGRIMAGMSLRLTPPGTSTRPTPFSANPAHTLNTPNSPSLTTANSARPAEPGPDPSEREAAPAQWVWPSDGELVTRFNESDGSKGVDLAGTRGTPVLASAEGKVVYAGAGLRGYGQLVIIKHSRTLLTAYGHHDRLLVKEGQQVGRGERIGLMGDTDADRVKLHFEIREFGKPVDPLRFLPKRAENG